MEALLGFKIDLWDYLTFLTLFLLVVVLIAIWLWLAGMPGRIALARKHPEAEAVKLLGYAGLLPTIYPWVQAFIWAFKPTEIIDIRRFPKQEQKFIEEEVVRLGGEDVPESKMPTEAEPEKAPSEEKLPSSDGGPK